MATFEDFMNLDIRAGEIVKAEKFLRARKPAYKVWVDFGKDIGIRKSSAQITDLYEIESLVGKQVMAVVNFPAKQIGPIMSDCLVTGFYREDGKVVLAVPDQEVQDGARLG